MEGFIQILKKTKQNEMKFQARQKCERIEFIFEP
jgi:hypothetical protein